MGGRRAKVAPALIAPLLTQLRQVAELERRVKAERHRLEELAFGAGATDRQIARAAGVAKSTAKTRRWRRGQRAQP